MLKKDMTRRAAVGTIALATASLVASDPVSASKVLFDRRADAIQKGSPPKETLEEFFWLNAVSERFKVHDYTWLESSERPEQASLELLSVTRLIPRGDDKSRPKHFRPFAISLLFQGSPKISLQPASYTLLHRTLGKFELLLSETRTRSGDVLYEAVLN